MESLGIKRREMVPHKVNSSNHITAASMLNIDYGGHRSPLRERLEKKSTSGSKKSAFSKKSSRSNENNHNESSDMSGSEKKIDLGERGYLYKINGDFD